MFYSSNKKSKPGHRLVTLIGNYYLAVGQKQPLNLPSWLLGIFSRDGTVLLRDLLSQNSTERTLPLTCGPADQIRRHVTGDNSAQTRVTWVLVLPNTEKLSGENAL